MGAMQLISGCFSEGAETVENVDVMFSGAPMGNVEMSVDLNKEEFTEEEGLKDEVSTICNYSSSELSHVEHTISEVSQLERTEFVAIISKRLAQQKLGLEIHNIGGKCMVACVKGDGLIGDWNRRNPSLQIGIGDWILAVNGVSSYISIRRVCGEARVLKFRVSQLTQNK